MKRSTDLYDLLDRRWDELDHIAKSQLAQKSPLYFQENA